MKEINLFGNLSNLINYRKSTALNISLPPETVSQCAASLPFLWQTKAITYLCVQLPSALSDLYSLNFVPLLKYVQDDLKAWNKPGLSWFGRVTAIKMMVLPKLLYLM